MESTAQDKDSEPYRQDHFQSDFCRSQKHWQPFKIRNVKHVTHSSRTMDKTA